MNDKIIDLLIKTDDEINIQKVWIEIANILSVEDENYGLKTGLIMRKIDEQNKQIHANLEILMAKLFKSETN